MLYPFCLDALPGSAWLLAFPFQIPSIDFLINERTYTCLRVDIKGESGSHVQKRLIPDLAY